MELVGMEPNELLTADQAAAKFHVCRRTILRWAREGKLEYVKISAKVVLFSAEAVDRFVKSRTVDVESPTTDHQRFGRRMVRPEVKKGGGKKTSGESWSDLRKEVASWQ